MAGPASLVKPLLKGILKFSSCVCIDDVDSNLIFTESKLINDLSYVITILCHTNMIHCILLI